MIKNFKELSSTPSRRKALQIIDSGLESINTEKVMKNNIKLKNSTLTIKNKKINLKKFKRIVIIGFGKASSL